LASAPAFLPGQQKDGFKRPTEFEMIQKMKSETCGIMAEEKRVRDRKL